MAGKPSLRQNATAGATAPHHVFSAVQVNGSQPHSNISTITQYDNNKCANKYCGNTGKMQIGLKHLMLFYPIEK